MNEYPVWIPVGSELHSATITVPDTAARGLVLLLPGGGGAPRSHRYAMFTAAARELASRNIASVRMDWRGIGDSTGGAGYNFHALPADAAAEVARFAMKATGTAVFGMAGNCGGARTALQTLPMIPGASSAVLMMLKPLTGTRSEKQAVRKAKKMVRGIPRLGKLLRSAYWASRWRKANPVLDQVRALSPRIDVLFMEASTVKVGRLPKFVDRLKREGGDRRLELRFFPGGSTRAFQSLERQEMALSGMVDWFDRTLPAASTPGNTVPEPTPAATHL